MKMTAYPSPAMLVVPMLITTLLSTSAMAVGKSTADPNATAAIVNEADAKRDTRLAQKVTYSASRRSVAEILAELSKTTGVTLLAGQNNNDWQVRDRKMNVFGKSISLADLMSSMARVMKFKWSAKGEGDKTTYRLFMDRRTLLDAETQAQRDREKYEEKLAEEREKYLRGYGDLDKLSAQDQQKLRNDSPFAYYLTKSGIAGALGRLFQDIPPASEALATGQQLTLSAADLSEAGRRRLSECMRAFAGAAARLSPGQSLPDGVGTIGDRSVIQINRNLENFQAMPMGGLVLGELTVYDGAAPEVNPNSLSISVNSSSVEFPLLNPNSAFANVLGKALTICDEQSKPVDEVMKGLDSEIDAAVQSDIAKDQNGEPAQTHADDPGLHEKISLPVNDGSLEGVQSALADAIGLSVVSDSFGDMHDKQPIGKGEFEVKDILEKIASGFRYNWDKRSRAVEFRDRDWFRKRNAQIPQAWIDAWKATLKDTGTLDAGDLGQIAMLTQEQFNVNILSDEVLSRCNVSGAVFPNRDVLRIYAQLSANQRAAVLTSTGLDPRTLAPEQWKAIEQFIAQRNSKFLEDPETPLVLSGTRASNGKLYDYSFSIAGPKEIQPLTWKFTTPAYKEAPKDDKKGAGTTAPKTS